jgi:4-amino-4-deoxy-L-arabinose transferase-like glycosyltransferase
MTPRRILLVAGLVFMLYAYPGFMLNESANHLVDSRIGLFTDWQSPMMTLLWRILGIVVSGPPGMLFIQMFLVLVGSYQLLRRRMSDRAAAIAASCVLLFPPVMAGTAVITTHALLAAFTIAGTAAVTSERFAYRLGGLGLFVLACGMDVAGCFVSFVVVLTQFRWRNPLSRARRLAIAFAAWLATVSLAFAISYAVVDVREQRNQLRLAMHDILGTINYADTLGDAEIRELLPDVALIAEPDLQKRARFVYGKVLFYAVTEFRVFEPIETQTQRDRVFAARRKIALALPGAYLRHRWQELYRTLGLARHRPWSPVYMQYVEHPMDAAGTSYMARESAVQRTVAHWVTALSETFLFRPYFYLLVALVLVPFAVMRRTRDGLLMLGVALAYELGLFFFVYRQEFRAAHLLIIATLLALVMVVHDRMRSRPPTQTLT